MVRELAWSNESSGNKWGGGGESLSKLSEGNISMTATPWKAGTHTHARARARLPPPLKVFFSFPFILKSFTCKGGEREREAKGDSKREKVLPTLLLGILFGGWSEKGASL